MHGILPDLKTNRVLMVSHLQPTTTPPSTMATRGEQTHTMDQLWEDVSARFHQRTGKSLDLKPARTLNDCIQEIEGTRQPTDDPAQKETHSRTDTAKEYGRNILQCLKLLGGVAAEGAAMVFNPSLQFPIGDWGTR